MDESDRLVRAIETGAVLTLGWMVFRVAFSWAVRNVILLVILFIVIWAHDTGTGRRTRVAQINSFPTTSVVVSDVSYQSPSGSPDYFTATLTNSGPARIYDVSISCNMIYRASADREATDKVNTQVNLGYVNPGETAHLRLNADASGLRLMENVRVGFCSPKFTPEETDMLKLGKAK